MKKLIILLALILSVYVLGNAQPKKRIFTSTLNTPRLEDDSTSAANNYLFSKAPFRAYSLGFQGTISAFPTGLGFYGALYKQGDTARFLNYNGVTYGYVGIGAYINNKHGIRIAPDNTLSFGKYAGTGTRYLGVNSDGTVTTLPGGGGLSLPISATSLTAPAIRLSDNTSTEQYIGLYSAMISSGIGFYANTSSSYAIGFQTAGNGLGLDISSSSSDGAARILNSNPSSSAYGLKIVTYSNAIPLHIWDYDLNNTFNVYGNGSIMSRYLKTLATSSGGNYLGIDTNTGLFKTMPTPSSGGSGSGTVTSIATTAPITGGTITSSGTIGITQATTSSNGYLSSTDWNTFNGKEPALGNPSVGGYVLASSITGVRSWVQLPNSSSTIATQLKNYNSSSDTIISMKYTPGYGIYNYYNIGTAFTIETNQGYGYKILNNKSGSDGFHIYHNYNTAFGFRISENDGNAFWLDNNSNIGYGFYIGTNLGVGFRISNNLGSGITVENTSSSTGRGIQSYMGDTISVNSGASPAMFGKTQYDCSKYDPFGREKLIQSSFTGITGNTEMGITTASLSSKSNDRAGRISLITGNGGFFAGLLATVTFAHPYADSDELFITFSPCSATSVPASQLFYIQSTNTGFSIYATSALTGSYAVYTINYIISH